MSGGTTGGPEVAREPETNTSQMLSATGPAPTVPRPKGLGYRWTIVALLFFATTINYVDRQVLGILAPTLTTELGWSETDYGATASWFSFAYGFGLLLMGRALDSIGVRRDFSYRDCRLEPVGDGTRVRPHGRSLLQPVPRSASAKAATSPARSRPSPSGSQNENAPSPPVSSMPAATWARSSRH